MVNRVRRDICNKNNQREKVRERQEKNAIRELTITSGLADFASNDYLGLARSQELAEYINSKHNSTNGSTGSRLLTGNSPEIENLENNRSQATLKDHAVRLALYLPPQHLAQWFLPN